MPTWYCSSSQCGHRVTYLTQKPTQCPNCKTEVLDPFKIIAQASSIAMASLPPETRQIDRGPLRREEMKPLKPVVRSSKSTPVNRKEPESKIERARRLRDSNLQASEDVDDDSDDFEDDGEPLDPRKARRLARELIASIDPSTIRVENPEESDQRVTFGKWCGRP